LHGLVLIVKGFVPFVEVEETLSPKSGLSLQILDQLRGDLFIPLLLIVLWRILAFLAFRVLSLRVFILSLLSHLLLFVPNPVLFLGGKLTDILILLILLSNIWVVLLKRLSFARGKLRLVLVD